MLGTCIVALPVATSAMAVMFCCSSHELVGAMLYCITLLCVAPPLSDSRQAPL